MGGLNVTPPPRGFDKDPYEVALGILDLLFSEIHSYQSFDLGNTIMKSKLTADQKKDGFAVQGKITEIGLKEGYYESLGMNLFQLTDKGKIIKEAGGYYAYKNKLADEKREGKERQRLNDEKLKIDIKNAKRIHKTYWWTFGMALVALLLTLGKILYDILSK